MHMSRDIDRAREITNSLIITVGPCWKDTCVTLNLDFSMVEFFVKLANRISHSSFIENFVQ